MYDMTSDHVEANPRRRVRLDPLDLAEHGENAAVEWLTAQAPHSTPIIYATAAPTEVRATQDRLGAERAGALVEATLAACAVKARDLGFRRFVVAGGETSGAVTNALKITRLDIGPEITPGVPWCFARTGEQDVAITLKSGNFGNEDFFTKALEVLET
jgi:3-dehydrotetronate 4-kinase